MNELEEFKQCVKSLKLHYIENFLKGKKWELSPSSTLIEELPESLINEECLNLDYDNQSNIIEELDNSLKDDFISIKETPSSLNNTDNINDINFESKNMIVNDNVADSFEKSNVESLTQIISNKDDFKLSDTSNVIFIRFSPFLDESLKDNHYNDQGGKFLTEKLMSKDKNLDSTSFVYLFSELLDYTPIDSSIIESKKNIFIKKVKENKINKIICLGERISRILSGINEPINQLMTKSIKKDGISMYFTYDPFFVLKNKDLQTDYIKKLVEIV